MEKYQISRRLGEGTYGTVSSAINTATGYAVAIKTLKDRCPSVGAMARIPEVHALQALTHPNIVTCLESILDGGTVHLVFELMDGGDLEAFCRKVPAPQRLRLFRCVVESILEALRYMHAAGFLHRDVKPENVLLSHVPQRSRNGEPTVKLADLGLTRVAPTTPGLRPMTSYVATRWYRAPEQLLKMTTYGPAADMWSVGATIAEILTAGKPLFPGDNEEETLREVFRLRGHPEAVGWGAGAIAADRTVPGIRKGGAISLDGRLEGAPKEMVRLVEGLLQLDPRDRLTADEALRCPLFQDLGKENIEPFNATPLRSKESLVEDGFYKRRKIEIGVRGRNRGEEDLFTGSRGDETMVLGTVDSTPSGRVMRGMAMTQSPVESQLDGATRLRDSEVTPKSQDQIPFFNIPIDPTIDLTGNDGDDEVRSHRSPAGFFNLPSAKDSARSPFRRKRSGKQPFSIIIPPTNENRKKRGRQDR